MKVLHCSSYLNGGAGIATQRLHVALQESGKCCSSIGVRKKNHADPHVMELAHPVDIFLTRLSNLPLRVIKKDPDVFFSSYLLPNTIAHEIKKIQPDIVHLHWISNFMSPWTLRQVAKLSMPVIWTLHDTWPFTGGCHYGTCTKWQQECLQCPLLKYGTGNLAHLVWQEKKKTYANLQPHIVVPSIKLMQKVQNSSLLQTFPATHIPNAVDSQIFYPIDKKLARQQLGLKEDTFYILFGAISAISDHNKGYDLLKDALEILASNSATSCQCLIFGASEGPPLPLPTTFLGHINEQHTLALAYAAADVFVCPSREESFSNTTLESLACGTPMVGFDIGGIPDMVTHKESGYIATPYDTKDLARGIAYILEDDARRQYMGQQARSTVEERYSSPVVAKQYIKLYEELLAKKGKAFS